MTDNEITLYAVNAWNTLCIFCQQPCAKQDTALRNIPTYGRSYWICSNHKHAAHFFADLETLELDIWFFSTEHQGRIYAITAYLEEEDKRFEMQQYEREKGLTSSPVKLKFIPNHITPDNIDNKISTLLIFS